MRRDARGSSRWLADRVALGLALCKGGVQSSGVTTAAGVAYLARSRKFDAGVVVSASHNPWTDNGIKVFSGDGYKLPDSDELDIEKEIFALLQDSLANDSSDSSVPYATPNEIPAPSLPGDAGLRRAYIEWLA